MFYIDLKDNLYTDGPQFPDRFSNTLRSNWRPLPPLPVPTADVSPVPVATTSSSVSPQPVRSASPQELYEAIFTADTHTQPTAPPRPQSSEPLSADIPADEGPPPYESIGESLQSSPMSLRESQVVRLRKEILHPSGVRLMV